MIRTLPSDVQMRAIVIMLVFTIGLMSRGFTPRDAMRVSRFAMHRSKDAAVAMLLGELLVTPDTLFVLLGKKINAA